MWTNLTFAANERAGVTRTAKLSPQRNAAKKKSAPLSRRALDADVVDACAGPATAATDLRHSMVAGACLSR
jgi:hypothetical protein